MSTAAPTPEFESVCDDFVCESATELPVAFDVDVVVAGGSLAGVEAACAAAENGASVLLVESRPYLGFDLCGTQRLWIDDDETPETELTQQLFGGKRVVTPFEVKKALDEALIHNGIPFLTGTFAGELLVDDSGAVGGITIVNRSGRQVARAKVIIDATKDAVLARQSPGSHKPFTPGPKEFEIIVVGGELVKGVVGRQLPTPYRSPTKDGEPRDYPVFEYGLDLTMESDTVSALSKAFNEARSLVHSPDTGIVDSSEFLIYYPENTIVPSVPVSATGAVPGDLLIGAFQPDGIESLYVLSAYAGLDRSLMKKVMRPTSIAVVGRRIGTAAATAAHSLATPEGIGYVTPSGNSSELAVTAAPASFRFKNCPKLELDDHALPIFGAFNVVVVGGGTAGASAGIGAARDGARTLVIEPLDELGGVGTAGLIGQYWYGRRIGFTAEMDEVLGTSWDVIRKSEWYRAALLKNGAQVWHECLGCGTLLKGDKVSGVVVATPFGRGAVLADVVIDSTGNADVAASAGAATQFSISTLGGLSVQLAGMPHRDLGDRCNNTCFAMVDDRDVFDRWHLLLSARRGKAAEPYDAGQLIDTRDRRRIVGDHVLSTADILMHRTFPDTICHHRSNFDAAAFPDSEMLLIKDMKGPVYDCDMPFRCLTPKGVEGLLVVGLGASAERDAMTLTRMQPDLQNQGYAAGVAAALAAAKTGGMVREIDIRHLQALLVEEGCLEERVLTDRDSFPIAAEELSEAVTTLHSLTIEVHEKPDVDDTMPALAAVMAHPKDALPLLRRAYTQADDRNVRTNFARILVLLGDATGKETLIEAVEAAEGWGEGCGLTSHRKSDNTFGQTDRLVIALGFLRIPQTRPLLVRKLESLAAESDLSHYKAICLALRLNRDASLAEPLARLLNKPGVSGHSQPLSYYCATDGALSMPGRATTSGQGSNVLNSKFKELLIAALLLECGDLDNQARNVLDAYTKDVNGHFASYASFVLNGRARGPD
ncbi:MAG: FAD-dependent oxidoreductase [Lentisphaerae bacterium]|jgi:hypothetical protein|nr:FAD-dependent oxidoreductase [Lentisphaerota bacterium]MBT4822080.1 FAD-dependent oxidoreductase [Lentisphaerota bacterium]MBT5611160.1 FAD-dependent oxidoreductase [Lentisphaerota bacterium]MBT7054716.1 FAD-dependent oxidoreductase [Lentisphaerota bacterium]MBT7841974.1 FAD-dependent oxidoreductase [Lentisphaerota bacterium]